MRKALRSHAWTLHPSVRTLVHALGAKMHWGLHTVFGSCVVGASQLSTAQNGYCMRVQARIRMQARFSTCSLDAGDDAERAALLAAGTWGMDLLVISLPDLRLVLREPLGAEVIPRR